MPEVHDVVDRLRRERDAITTGDHDAGLRRVESLARTHRRRRIVVGGAGALVVVAAFVATVTIVGDQRPDLVVTDTSPDETETLPSAPAPTTPEREVVPTTPSATSPGPTAPTAPTAPSAPSGDGADPGPTLGATLPARPATGAFVDVTAAVETAAGDSFPMYAGEWNGQLIVGGFEQAAVSSDGLTWAPISIAPLPPDFGWGIRTAIGDRVVTGGVRITGDPSPLVASTTDLTSWTIQAIPVDWPTDLPDVVDPGAPPQLTANEAGWVATVMPSARVDWNAVASERLGRSVDSVRVGWTDDGVRIRVDDDGPADGLVITEAELEAEWGPDVLDLVRGVRPVEIWAGTWDDSTPPTRQVLPQGTPDAWTTGEAVSTDDGVVVIRQHPTTVVDDVVPAASIELVAGHRAPDGSFQWEMLEPPFGGSLRSAFALDGDLGVVGSSDSGTLAVYRVDTPTERWTPIDVPALPADARSIQWQLGDVVLLDVAPPDPIASTTISIEQNGLRLTWNFDYPDSTYEVVEIVSGEVIVGETIDLRDVEGSFEDAFEHLSGGIGRTVITDPETGDVLMDISAEQMRAAQPSTPEPIPPQPWILASTDGDVWLSRALATSDGGSWGLTHAVVTGHRLLAQTTGGAWFVVDLR